MTRYIVRRLLLALPMLILISFLTFMILYMIPGDPVASLNSNFPASTETLDRIRQFYGLDKPFLVRYADYLTNLLRGNMGVSLAMRRPVAEVILEQLPSSATLGAYALSSGAILGVIFGVVAGLNANSYIDSAIMVTAVLGVSIPSFWLGLLTIFVFVVNLRWLTILGSGPSAMVLPVFTLAVYTTAYLSRLMRSSMLEVLGEDYIRTARAKGLIGRVVVYKHALRNACLPVISLLGLQTGEIITGSVIIETVFARRGVGRLAVDSVLSMDVPVVQGIVMMIAFWYMMINLAIDIIYGFVDPRIKYA